MADRDWMNIPDEPLLTREIKSTNMISETPQQKLKDALLGIADLAYTLKPGQHMVVQRHADDDERFFYRRIFTVKIYKQLESEKTDEDSDSRECDS